GRSVFATGEFAISPHRNPNRCTGGAPSEPSARGRLEHAMTSTSLPLVFEAPRRGMPPRHRAALSAEELRAAVTELGEKPFRARQLAHHYFARLNTDAEAMTDLPASSRDKLVGQLMPPLLTPVRYTDTDGGTTRKTLWRAHDGTLLE